MVTAHCFKEKKKVEVVNPEYKLNKKGGIMLSGKCASCGGSVTTIPKRSDVPAAIIAKLGKKGGATSRRSTKSKSKQSKSSRKSRRSNKKIRSRKLH